MARVADRNNISDAEWEVMRVVWANESCYSQVIIDVLQEKMDWKPATSKTLIGRLVKKGYLTTTSDGKRYLYTTDTTEPESLRAEIDTLLSQICKRNVPNLVSYLIDECMVTQDQRDDLVTQLLHKKVVEKIPCTCTPGQCTCHLHVVNSVISKRSKRANAGGCDEE